MFNIPEYVSIPYVRAQFEGCTDSFEEFFTGVNGRLNTKVHFHFRNVRDAMLAFLRVFKLPLGIHRKVCFRRINVPTPLASTGLDNTSAGCANIVPVAEISNSVLDSESEENFELLEISSSGKSLSHKLIGSVVKCIFYDISNRI